MVEERMLQLTVVEQDADRLALAHKLLGLRKRGMSYYACSREMMMTVAALRTLKRNAGTEFFAP
jgi:hypothetical protein